LKELYTVAIFWSMWSDLRAASNRILEVVETQKRSFKTRRLATEDMKGGN